MTTTEGRELPSVRLPLVKSDELPGGKPMALSPDEANIIRQWFDAVQDLNPSFLARPDFVLARRVYEHLNMRAPDSIAWPK